MSLLIVVILFLMTRWDKCSIEDRKIINRLFGFITLRTIAIEDVRLIETDAEIIAKQTMSRRGPKGYNYLRITYFNKRKNKDVRYIMTPDNDEIFKKEIQLMQKDVTIKAFIRPKSRVANIIVSLFTIITIYLSCWYAVESFNHPIITFSLMFLVSAIYRYIIIKINNKLYIDYRSNLEKYAIRDNNV